MFNLEQNCTTMNKNQSLMWDNPRFRNWIAVARACQLVKQSLERELRPLDLKTPHLDIMVNVMRTEGISQQDLATKLLVARSNITMLLPQLEKRGLIERRPDTADRRVLRLYLTDEGHALALRAIEIQAALIDDMMSVSSLEDCNLVGETMRKVATRLLERAGDDREIPEAEAVAR
jgi:DNA-binding MarR family transcriptional regulator